jgi:hypothetical protein
MPEIPAAPEGSQDANAPRYRYADYLRASGAGVAQLSLNRFIPSLEIGADGQPLPYRPAPMRLRPYEVARILQPYVSVRFNDQLRAVVPLALYLALFQILFLRHLVDDAWLVTGGIFAVIVGLMLFMEGLKIGLMPFGTIIGEQLPRKLPLSLVLVITLMLGIGVTFAEPAIGALKMAGQIVSVDRAPYLYALLNDWSDALVLVVGAAVGLAAVVGTLRFLYGWSLKPLIVISLILVFAPTLYVAAGPGTGHHPWTRLGHGRGDHRSGDGTAGAGAGGRHFRRGRQGRGRPGRLRHRHPGFALPHRRRALPRRSTSRPPPRPPRSSSRLGWRRPHRRRRRRRGISRSPGVEIISGVRAILPLVIFLFLVLTFVLRERLANRAEIFLGIGLTILGMCIFNVGLTYGLSLLGSGAGSLVPTAFMEVDGVAGSPLYDYRVGLVLALAFAWFLGYGATVAEPALSALGQTAEQLTSGVFKKKTLIVAVSVGVACGIALGIAKMVFDLPLVWLLVGGYAVALVLTLLSSEAFVNVAWDSAGVTTGPVTVPLVLAMGLGFGNATEAVEGFGILCMASVGPIITVLLSGLWSRFKIRRETREATRVRHTSAIPATGDIL